jgi:xylulokinase
MQRSDQSSNTRAATAKAAGTHDALMVGVDVGTTNIKAVIFDRTGSILATASVLTPTVYPRPTWAYYDPEELWQRSAQAVRQAVAQLEHPAQIVSIGVTSTGETGVPLDRHGNATYESIAWFDGRTKTEAQWLDETIGADRLFAITGLSLQPIFSLCKILWVRKHAPEAFARTVRWLNAADYIAFRLSGEQATDHSLASRMLMLNLRQLCWAEELVREVGLDPGLLAPLARSGDYLGRVRPEAAALTGLSTATIVGAGGHDHVCGALAVGVVEPGNMLNSLGTAEAAFLPLPQPMTDPETGRQGYTQGAHTAGGYYVFGGSYTSGACIDWFRQSFAPDADFATLTAEAAAVPPGSLGVTFCPFLRLANPPYADSKARGAFVGLSTDIKRGALFRAVLEGIALDTRNGLDPLLVHTGLGKLNNIYAIGGTSRNRLLMQIKANIFQQPIHVMSIEESTAHGAAVLGGKAAGVYADVADIVHSIERTETVVEPDPAAVGFYDELFHSVYQQIYPALRNVNHSIFDLQQKATHVQ